jgi:hypothetical protein
MTELSKILAGLSLGYSGHEESALGPTLFSLWKRAVGEKIAGVCILKGYRSPLLTIGVTDDGWLRELTRMKSRIESRLHEAVGRSELRVKLVRARAAARERWAPAVLSCAPRPARPQVPSSLGKEIQDEELRVLFQQAHSRYREAQRKRKAKTA